MNKYVFLDIDGVLNDHKRFTSGYCGIDSSKMELLNNAQYDIGFSIIIISAWRYMILAESMTLDGFKNLLLTHGASIGLANSIENFIGKDISGVEKGQMIKDFVEEHRDRVSAYLIIDDMDQGYTEFGLPFLKTNGDVGIRDEDVERMRRHFAIPVKS